MYYSFDIKDGCKKIQNGCHEEMEPANNKIQQYRLKLHFYSSNVYHSLPNLKTNINKTLKKCMTHSMLCMTD